MLLKINKNKGQTLIEAILAIAVATVIISAIAVSVLGSIDNSIFSKNQNSATQYAQQAMDLMRQQRDTNWTEFNNLTTGTYCFDSSETKLVHPPDTTPCTTINIAPSFIRSVTIETNIAPCSEKKATVIVKWNDSKCNSGSFCHKVELTACFYKIN